MDMNLDKINVARRALKSKGWRQEGTYKELPVMVGPRWRNNPGKYKVIINGDGSISKFTIGYCGI